MSSKTLLSMDGEEHTKYRKVVVDWFKALSLRFGGKDLANLVYAQNRRRAPATRGS